MFLGDIQEDIMRELTQAEIEMVSGGEVGATGMGDDYSYTGQRSWGECHFDGITNNDRSILDMELIIMCLKQYN